jgi:hypothetical protein
MKQLLAIAFSFILTRAAAQDTGRIFTVDIDHFWTAYDSIQTTNDFTQKLAYINRLYLGKATAGLKAFMQVRDYNDTLYVQLIEKYPAFWRSIRPNTLSIRSREHEMNTALDRLKKLYPALKEAGIYFTIGGLRSGGTVDSNKVLIGAEIATGNAQTDVSEFRNNWLKNVFATQALDNIVPLNIHEYIHTQQTGDRNRVLSQCIKEGACDFIAELAIEKPLQAGYLAYGKAHADSIREQFRREMFSNNFSNWLYNGSNKGEGADLGYYVGYTICKAYYDKAKDKAVAIQRIIELDYDNDRAVEDFLAASGYFPEKINKARIIREYNKQLPFIVQMAPFKNGATGVDTATKELRITFSKSMQPDHLSIDLPAGGREHFPLTKLKGFEDNDRTMVLLLDLKAGKEYEFIITNRGFLSKDGYRLRDPAYLVKFKTR